MMNKLLAAGCLGLCALVLPFAASVSADEPVTGRVGRAEVRFLEGMIDHHQMALDMATDALATAGTDDIHAFSEAIIAAQSAEITQMQMWLRDWYGVEYAPTPMRLDDMSGMDMSAPDSMSGMDMSMPTAAAVTDPPMTMGMMAGLGRLAGVDYSVAWLESMIDHHDDALHMSERILTQSQATGHPELRALAEQIITAQTAEIGQMETLITTLSP